MLLARDRDAGDAAPQLARGVQREPAPAAADLEHVVVRAEAELVADAPVLGLLGVAASVIAGTLEERARVGQRRVEEEP